MSDTEYTPTTDEVMDAYCRNQGPAPRTGPEFRRWLAAHNAAVVKSDLNALADDLERGMSDVLDVPAISVGTMILALRKRADAL